MWERIILDGLKKQDELDLEKAAREAPDEEKAEILRNLPKHIQEITKNPEEYPDVISLLCLHMVAMKGELFASYSPKEQPIILENGAYASLKAVSLAEKLGDRELKALYFGMAGNAFFRIRRPVEAEKAYREALNVYQDLARETPRHRLSVVITLDNIGTFYCSMGRLSEAEGMYNESFKTMREIEKDMPDLRSHTATTLNNLGDFYKNTGKSFEAENAYKEALETRKQLSKENGNPEMNEPVAATLNCLGLLYFDMAKFSEALEKYKEALKMYKQLESDKRSQTSSYMPYIAGCSNNIGSCYNKMNNLSKAEGAYKRALRNYQTLERQNPALYSPQVATTLNNLGVLYYTRGRYSKARESYEKAIRKYMGMKSWFDASRTYYNFYVTDLELEYLEKSRRLLELGILFSEEKRYKYAQKGEKETLYLCLLQDKTEVLGALEALRDPYLLSLPWEAVLTEDELKRARDDLEFQKRLVRTILEQEIPRREPAILPDDVVVIYIQKIGDSAHFFVVNRGKIEEYHCGKEFFQEGENVLEYLRFQLNQKQRRGMLSSGVNNEERVQHKNDSPAKGFDAYAKKWYETLPAQIKELIQEKDYVVFSPDGPSSLLPLEALQRDREPLCIEKTIVRSTSLHQLWSFLNEEQGDLKFESSLIVGNPWLRTDQRKLAYSLPGENESTVISYLWRAEEEAKALQRELPNSTLLVTNGATGKEFLSQIKNASLIHFSGHGSMGRVLFLCGPFIGLLPRFESEEFFSLRKNQREEGAKSIGIMEDWHPITDVDLSDVTLKRGTVVFLNACDSGLHKYTKGGYFQGLSAVFLKNGAHAVISSLIPLFDDESKDFAIRFYKNLLETHSVSRSLREARIAIRDMYKDQIHWIPYVHYGSPFLEIDPTSKSMQKPGLP
ncbi:MAG: CHAT domain-containing protein [Theionarchaea archaeon]|nr:CHAT domain-containing protein [Theionarchaea archaeon]MBU7021372.1 CHAT domain-containing protein [Theionarchaea archaeon]